jgi:poly(3-hydroxybutyrate) depolymerase
MAAASCEVFEGLTRRYGKPAWGIERTNIFGLEVPVREEIVGSTPFCDLLHFDRDERVCGKR